MCAVCEINQDCCTNLHGLRLSKTEFESTFSDHHDSLLVNQYGGIFIVSGQNNSCPNWRKNQCSVYDSRPTECRLFPFAMGMIFRIARLVVVTYHSRTICPQKHHLLVQVMDARNMLTSFAKDVYDRDIRVLVFYDSAPFRVVRYLRRLPHKILRTIVTSKHNDN